MGGGFEERKGEREVKFPKIKLPKKGKKKEKKVEKK